MKKAVKTLNEDQRLKALQDLEILDSESEQAFDRITELGAMICEVPICLVSFVDENRQWFKSKVGLDACETSRDISFCGHAIQQNKLLEVVDASLDMRFFDNPLVTGEPKIRFYAGQPIADSNGYLLGTLCVIDRKPKNLTENQKKSLAILVLQIQDLLNMRSKSIEFAKSKSSEAMQGLTISYSHHLNNILMNTMNVANSIEGNCDSKKKLQDSLEKIRCVIKGLRNKVFQEEFQWTEYGDTSIMLDLEKKRSNK